MPQLRHRHHPKVFPDPQELARRNNEQAEREHALLLRRTRRRLRLSTLQSRQHELLDAIDRLIAERSSLPPHIRDIDLRGGANSP